MSVSHLFSRVRGLVSTAFVAGALAFSASASAAPVIGAQLFWAGGNVTITVMESTAGFTSKLNLYNPDSSTTFIAFNAPNGNAIGTVKTLLAADLDLIYDIGDELVFGIEVPDSFTSIFRLGPGSRNADGLQHGAIDSLGGGAFVVGFEDLRGGGDLDYDDNLFRFEGGVRANVPEPASLALVGLALLGAAAATRRQRRRH